MSYQSDNMAFNSAMDSLSHYGVLGMKWGVRNADTLRKYEGPQGGERRKTSFSERAETRVTKSGKQIAPVSKRQVQRENSEPMDRKKRIAFGVGVAAGTAAGIFAGYSIAKALKKKDVVNLGIHKTDIFKDVTLDKLDGFKWTMDTSKDLDRFGALTADKVGELERMVSGQILRDRAANIKTPNIKTPNIKAPNIKPDGFNFALDLSKDFDKYGAITPEKAKELQDFLKQISK